jgi:two-component system sensor histidine kinase AtoS
VRYFKKTPFISYEIEIKISLVVLIAFLLSLNLISAYSLKKVRQAQREGFSTKIDLSAELIENQIRLDNYKLPGSSLLNDIRVLSGADMIEIADSAGNRLIAVGVALNRENERMSTPFIRDISVRNRQGLLVYRIRLAGINREEAGLRRLAFLDLIFRSLGLIAGLVAAFLFFRSVMNPYRKIKQQASNLDISLKNYDERDGVEYAVKLFQAVIQELKEKEAILQAMYDNSEKRADSLARYNEYILGSISSGVIICDNQGIITKLNRSATIITGFSESAAHGKHLNEVFGKKHKISQVLRDAIAGKTYSRQEFEINRGDGTTLWIGLTSSQITDDKDNLIGAAVLLTDLTRIKKLQEIAEYREKMAALGEMSAGLAHELRNSVAAIMGFGKLLKKMSLPDARAVDIVDTVIAESMATEEMLSRFLNFAKPLNLTMSRFDIEEVIEECLKISDDQRANKAIEFQINKEGEIPILYGDPVLIKTALSNLIINACQAITGSGRVDISIEASRRDNSIQISISDNGIGIPSEIIPKIFDPFFTTKETGTGLGLALVKKIITAHNGTIEAFSGQGRGTTFIITLPVESRVRVDGKTDLEQLPIEESAHDH